MHFGPGGRQIKTAAAQSAHLSTPVNLSVVDIVHLMLSTQHIVAAYSVDDVDHIKPSYSTSSSVTTKMGDSFVGIPS